MAGDTTYPVTMGQLSVWRDVEKMPPERRWEANLAFVWDIPAGYTADAVWAALAAVAMRHESMRTTYVLDPEQGLRQRLAVDDPATVVEWISQGSADIGELATLEDKELQHAIDVTSSLPWRVWLLTDAGQPVKLLLVSHHIAADGAGALVLQSDFRTLLTGGSLEPAGSPRDLALRQSAGEGSSRIRASERYWRRTLAAAPRVGTASKPGTAIGATLYTGIPLPLAHDGAAALDISAASLVMAAFYQALRSATGAASVLLYPMSSNRFDADLADLVTSLNQWVPLVLDFDASVPFAEMAKKVHWKTFNALKNGIGDPDAIINVQAEYDQLDPPVDPGFRFNAILAPPGFSTGGTREPARVQWYDPARTPVPGSFYLIARGITTIDVLVRANRPGFDRDTMDACLTSIEDALLSIVFP